LAIYEPVTLARPGPDTTEPAMRGVLFLPLGDPATEIRRMWWARARRVPVVNGYSGHPSFLW
jgi:hypothetical protein